MTEGQWLAGSEPAPMLRHLADRLSGRKRRLYACGCCRESGFATPGEAAGVVEAGERLADGTAGPRDPGVRAAEHALTEALNRTDPVRHGRAFGRMVSAWFCTFEARPEWGFDAAGPTTIGHVRSLPAVVRGWLAGRPAKDRWPDRARWCGVLRCIAGNPFRPVAVDPSWLTPTVVVLASAIYEDRAFDRMPVLADALEEAGCDDAEVLLGPARPMFPGVSEPPG